MTHVRTILIICNTPETSDADHSANQLPSELVCASDAADSSQPSAGPASAMANFLYFDLNGVSAEVSAPAPERLISGNPQFRTWNLDEAAGGVYSGIWESTPGKWRVEYAEWEFCHIFSGVSILSEDDGAVRTLRRGDCFVIRPGFRGCWEVVETTRKAYVVKI